MSTCDVSACMEAVVAAHNEVRQLHAAGRLHLNAVLCEAAEQAAATMLAGALKDGGLTPEVTSYANLNMWRHAGKDYDSIADAVIALRAVGDWYQGGDDYRVAAGGARALAASNAARAFAKMVWKSSSDVGVSVRRVQLAQHDPSANTTRTTTLAVVVVAYSQCCADVSREAIVRINVAAGEGAATSGAYDPAPAIHARPAHAPAISAAGAVASPAAAAAEGELAGATASTRGPENAGVIASAVEAREEEATAVEKAGPTQTNGTATDAHAPPEASPAPASEAGATDATNPAAAAGKRGSGGGGGKRVTVVEGNTAGVVADTVSSEEMAALRERMASLEKQLEAMTGVLKDATRNESRLIAKTAQLEADNRGLRAQVDILTTRLRMLPPDGRDAVHHYVAPGHGYVVADTQPVGGGVVITGGADSPPPEQPQPHSHHHHAAPAQAPPPHLDPWDISTTSVPGVGSGTGAAIAEVLGAPFVPVDAFGGGASGRSPSASGAGVSPPRSPYHAGGGGGGGGYLTTATVTGLAAASPVAYSALSNSPLAAAAQHLLASSPSAFAEQREEDGRELDHALRLLENLSVPSPARQRSRERERERERHGRRRPRQGY